MPKRKTDEQFKQEVSDLVGNDYTFLDQYTNNHTKMRVKHNKCGHIYRVLPSNFIKGTRCPHCFASARGKSRRKTNNQFKQEVYNLVGDEYTFLDPYQGTHIKIKVKHNKCGHIYKVEPASFLQGRRCSYCAGLVKKTNTQFKQEVFDLVGNEYTVLDPYVNALTKIKIRHNKCNQAYEVTPAHFLTGRRCPYCFGKHKKTNAQFKQEVFNLVENEYTFLEAYVDDSTKIKVKHNKCGNIYEVNPSNFKQGYRCPYCSSSKGEVAINKILKSLGIKYEYQKTFDDLVDRDKLSYDFYIPSQSILIEYQGKQHYEPVDHFGGRDQFKLQQKHDQMKADYAKSHNYNLIAVPYTEDTFSKIKKYLLKHGLKQH